MSAVLQALSQLSNAIGNLEGSIESFEGTQKGKQRDMFAAPVKKVEQVANNNSIDTNLVARKLDSAIAKIESVLKEGRG